MPTKARAYAEQARADFDAYVASGEAAEPALSEHHRLQLLQMALEKIAKAFLYHAEPDARYSHHVVVSAINRLRTHAVAEAAGMKLALFSRMLDAAKPILLRIESASPSVGFDGRVLTREEAEPSKMTPRRGSHRPHTRFGSCRIFVVIPARTQQSVYLIV